MGFAEKMNAYIDEYVKIYNFSGIVRVTSKENVIFERSVGYADIENRVPITNKSRFSVYSLSKPFCAIALLLLADKGLIDLDKSPACYLEEAKEIDSRITLTHLLHHSSGLKDFNQQEEDLKRFQRYDLDVRSAVRYLTSLELNFEPGTSNRYSNINFTILALIIENVSGMSYAEYMNKYVFEPLGMKTATVDSKGLLIDKRVSGYSFNGEHIIKQEKEGVGRLFGAGDIVASVDDIYCLNRAIKNKLLLKESTWEKVLTPDTISTFGMGCRIVPWHGKKRIIHNGGHKGFRTLHVQLPDEDFDIIILSNFGFGNSRNTIAEAIYKAYFGNVTESDVHIEMDMGYSNDLADVSNKSFMPRKMPYKPLSSEIECKITGEYEKGMTVEKLNDFYCITIDGWQKIYAYPIDDFILMNEYIDEAYKINEDENGNIFILGKKKIS